MIFFFSVIHQVYITLQVYIPKAKKIINLNIFKDKWPLLICDVTIKIKFSLTFCFKLLTKDINDLLKHFK